MDALPLPLTRDIVLIGGGHAHALLLRAWGMNPLPGVRLTVINPAPSAPYTGMLPGHVAGHYGREDLEIDLVKLARFAGARVILGWVTAIDRAAKRIHLPGRAPIPYDVASVDIGITSDMPEIPGFLEHGVAAKPLGPYAARWRHHLETGGPVAVIGGGLAGVELALTMKHALPGNDPVTVIDAAAALEGVGEGAKSALLAELTAQNIPLIEHQRVAEVAADHLILEDGRRIAATLTVGAAGARPFPWLEETGLDLTDGFITVNDSLQSTNDPAIFAAGDCAHMQGTPRPKAGVFAVRAAPVLTANLRAAVSGGRLEPFRPQAHYLKLVSLGPKSALADKWGRAVKGGWVWRWKDHIDRTFMAKLADLPAMTRAPLPRDRADGMKEALGPKPLCGGCGAKVGPDILDDVLADLTTAHRDDVELGRGDDAAVIRFGPTGQVITTDHLRAFWPDSHVFARIAALHALGDIWAMGAAPQAALLQITLPPLSDEMQRRWLEEIMQAVAEVFATEGAAIAGGHTSIGAEFSLGFSLTGTSKTPLTLKGAQPGDALLLTRPIGSGVLLAAAMEGTAKGTDIAALLSTLTRSQGDAARALAPVAHAMTDVTGFGLAGHLMRMAEASGVTATL
ncbi:MAG: selenide, water dikinase SelD, partial [Silicimonas sp.]|nr:selenide, water dikinase SelD [Silicimonas sp.]